MKSQLVIVVIACVCPLFAQGDYSKIDTLRFSSTPPLLTKNFCAPCCFCDVMQVQAFLRTGVDPGPLSPQYMLTQAGPGYWDQSSTFVHGFGAFIGAGISGINGSCPAAMCPPLTRRLTNQMQEAALPFRSEEAFLTLVDVPDYPSALDYLDRNHGSAVVLTTGSYRAWAIIGVRDGKGIWLDHWQRVGPPQIVLMTEAEGTATWDSMIYGQGYLYEPANFMVLLNSR